MDREVLIDRPDKWLTSKEILDLYEQDAYWVDAYRERHQLTEMSHSYLMNVLRHLVQYSKRHISAAMIVLDYPDGDNTAKWFDYYEKPWETPLFLGVVREIRKREAEVDETEEARRLYRKMSLP